MINKFKKTILFVAFGLLAFVGSVHAVSVFNSNQVGTNPVAGSVLQTNGVTSTWVTTSSLGISGSGSSPTGTPNYIARYNNSGNLAVSSSIYQASSTGYIGIGTNAPATLLMVGATSTSNAGLIVEGNGAGTPTFDVNPVTAWFINDGNPWSFGIRNTTAGTSSDVVFYNGGGGVRGALGDPIGGDLQISIGDGTGPGGDTSFSTPVLLDGYGMSIFSPLAPATSSAFDITGSDAAGDPTAMIVLNNGHIGMGANPTSYAQLEVLTTQAPNPGDGVALAGEFSATLLPGQDGDFIIGVNTVATDDATNNKNNLGIQGFTGQAVHQGSGTAQVQGAYMLAANSGAGIDVNNYGAFIDSSFNGGTGSITNNYGLFVADQTAGTNNYAIKTGLGKVSFGDNVSVRTSTDFGYALGVNQNALGGITIGKPFSNITNQTPLQIYQPNKIGNGNGDNDIFVKTVWTPFGDGDELDGFNLTDTLAASSTGDGNIIRTGFIQGEDRGSGTHDLIVGQDNEAVTRGVFRGTNATLQAGDFVVGSDGSSYATSTGSILEADAIKIETPYTTVGVPTTNGYGINIADQVGATNNWAIKTGLGLNYFGDNVVIPTARLAVGTTTTSTATLNLAGTFQASQTSTFKGNVSTTIANALVTTGSNGILSGYVATSCAAGSAFTGLSATGTPTCTSYAPSTTIPTTFVSTFNGSSGAVNYADIGSGNVTTTKATSGGNTTTTISLTNSGVASGTYTTANITVSSSGIVTAASNGSVSTLSQITSYNGITTAGQGLSPIVMENDTMGNSTGTTIGTYFNAATTTLEAGGYVAVTAVVTDVLNFRLTWTDENGTAQTQNFVPMGLTTASISATGYSAFPSATFRVKKNTTTTLAVVLTTGIGSVTYDTGAWLKVIQ